MYSSCNCLSTISLTIASWRTEFQCNQRDLVYFHNAVINAPSIVFQEGYWFVHRIQHGSGDMVMNTMF